MTSRTFPGAPEFEAQPTLTAAPTFPPPPPPPPPTSSLSGGHFLSPRRRDNVTHPPALTTSIGGLGAQGGSFGSALSYTSAPNSTASLYGPFSPRNTPTTGPATSGNPRDLSPMASRNTAGRSVQYNPSEWVPMQGGSPQLGSGQFASPQSQSSQGRVLPSGQPEDPDALPPPPYSPHPTSTFDRVNPSLILTNTIPGSGLSQYSSPVNLSTTISPIAPSGPRTSAVRPRPISLILSGDPNAMQRHSGYFPLPPPPLQSGRSSRSSSQTPAERSSGALGRVSLTSRNRNSSGATHPSTLDTLQRVIDEAVRSSVDMMPVDNMISPPASRRAASEGPIGTSSNSSRTASRSQSRSPSRQGNWGSGLPLPGPPPGPPPSAARSQSASGVGDVNSRSLLTPAPRPKTRVPPQFVTSLDPVPPTPADWVEEQQAVSSIRQATPLHIDTSVTLKGNHSAVAADKSTESSAAPASSSSGLHRSAARREMLSSGIRERRTASRINRGSMSEELSALSTSSNPWAEALSVKPANLNLAVVEPASGILAQARRSGSESATSQELSAQLSEQSANSRSTNSSSHSTPRFAPHPFHFPHDQSAPTPPFSPGGEPISPTMENNSSPIIPPKALPTPPLQHHKTHSPALLPAAPGGRNRLVISSSHQPSEATPDHSPSLPRRLSTSLSRRDHPDSEIFTQESLKRHAKFLEQECAAGSDNERLKIFADYILAESRLRRRRYSQAWSSGNFDDKPVRDRWFESSMHVPQRSSGLQESIIASPIEPVLLGPLAHVQGRPDSAWWNTYQPCLSPIASLSMNDDISSRGRTPSRWWESQAGSGSEEIAGRKVGRSKRESKYMGVPRKLREAMEYNETRDVDFSADMVGRDASRTTYSNEKSNPERFGFYDEEDALPKNVQPQPTRISQATALRKLDVSRLVTLPPPYPRHYPAVNNSHPDLVSYRTVVRSLSDFQEVTARRRRYTMNIDALRKDTEQKILENRRTFRSNIQVQIQDGSLTYAEAAEAESAFTLDEHRMVKQRVQAEFDSFQDVVLNPLHEILNGRITESTSHLNELARGLMSDAQSPNPNQPQEEGDEQPELLEKLTQFKWLFEARENIHREIFMLLSERNERYKAIVLLAYEQSNNEEKVRDTEGFFANDDRTRRIAFGNEVLKRYKEFLHIIDSNVRRGVEMQLSAFWDIAPELASVLHLIPEDLRTFTGVEIPPKELEENPDYTQFPLQYLWSLLTHAERSTYQFIESQTNLLCLLHEAKTGLMTAEIKLAEAEARHVMPRKGDEGDADTATAEEAAQHDHLARVKAGQESALTVELKEKVAMIEEQWVEALGSQLESTKMRIKANLAEEGGWESLVQDEEV